MELKEISLNILDIAFNSVKSGASVIEISVIIHTDTNKLIVEIKDNGAGFNVSEYKKETARKSRRGNSPQKRGGNGLRLFKESAEKTGGSFFISSEKGLGACVRAEYILNSPLCAPLGDMAETIAVLMLCEGKRVLAYTYSVDDKSFNFKTEQIKEMLGNISAEKYEIIKLTKEFIRKNTDFINRNRFF